MSELERGYMVKDKKIIICTKAAKRVLKTKKIIATYTISTTYKDLIKSHHNKKNTTVLIYDITKNINHKNLETIEVKDHINKTGENPLIENKKKFLNQFVDITNLYKPKEYCFSKTTTSEGKRFPLNFPEHKYPSSYLCNIAIICKALKFSTIRGFLINKL